MIRTATKCLPSILKLLLPMLILSCAFPSSNKAEKAELAIGVLHSTYSPPSSWEKSTETLSHAVMLPVLRNTDWENIIANISPSGEEIDPAARTASYDFSPLPRSSAAGLGGEVAHGSTQEGPEQGWPTNRLRAEEGIDDASDFAVDMRSDRVEDWSVAGSSSCIVKGDSWATTDETTTSTAHATAYRPVFVVEWLPEKYGQSIDKDVMTDALVAHLFLQSTSVRQERIIRPEKRIRVGESNVASEDNSSVVLVLNEGDLVYKESVLFNRMRPVDFFGSAESPFPNRDQGFRRWKVEGSHDPWYLDAGDENVSVDDFTDVRVSAGTYPGEKGAYVSIEYEKTRHFNTGSFAGQTVTLGQGVATGFCPHGIGMHDTRQFLKARERTAGLQAAFSNLYANEVRKEAVANASPGRASTASGAELEELSSQIYQDLRQPAVHVSMTRPKPPDDTDAQGSRDDTSVNRGQLVSAGPTTPDTSPASITSLSVSEGLCDGNAVRANNELVTLSVSGFPNRASGIRTDAYYCSENAYQATAMEQLQPQGREALRLMKRSLAERVCHHASLIHVSGTLIDDPTQKTCVLRTAGPVR